MPGTRPMPPAHKKPLKKVSCPFFLQMKSLESREVRCLVPKAPSLKMVEMFEFGSVQLQKLQGEATWD